MEKPGKLAFGQAFFGSYLSYVYIYITIYIYMYIYIYYGYTMLYKLGQQPRCHLASKSWDHGTRGTPPSFDGCCPEAGNAPVCLELLNRNADASW